MEDPEYAAHRGLTIVHLLRERSEEQWVMLSKAWGEASPSILEVGEDSLSEYHKEEIKEFRALHCPDTTQHLWRLRLKKPSESRKGVIRYDTDGTLHWHPYRRHFWQGILFGSMAVLILFYAVAIIVTNSTFSPVFIEYYFWIAIVWSLISSGLLSWVVYVLGATKRDTMLSFLAGLSLWLVVIQIGQTHFSNQLSQSPSRSSSD
ncbi:hypothetical protein EV356DRAFT_210758 [Viridothelium virens]|uniref:Uncharacterized protein n=1 Tax=Viridothelium virens TaxID=1048519 RepID=A0A6A6H682_VIRVR|nr:hypothetical protein EV356DRAFT_210758 [Viridothelium virens]